MPEPLHRIAGRYEIVGPLGRGGMADVHRAHDLLLQRDVAIKVLRDVSDVDRARFAGEAQLLARMSHESVVSVYDAGIDDHQPWLALELVEGRSLGEVTAAGPLAAVSTADLGAQVAAGLAHAHGHGIVHRDVKPSNILVTDTGRARLTDFGIARLVDSSTQLTLTGHSIGTAAYLAPEQVRGERVTGAADVYALGLVLLEALTGRRVYAGPPVEAALARLHASPLIPASLPRGWPGLLAAMTATAPEERPSAAAVAARLHELASAGGVVLADDPTATAMFPTVDAEPAPVRSRSVPARALLGLAAVTVAAAMVIHGATGDEPVQAQQSSDPPTTASTAPTSDAPRPVSTATAAPVVASTSPSARPAATKAKGSTKSHRPKHHRARHHKPAKPHKPKDHKAKPHKPKPHKPQHHKK